MEKADFQEHSSKFFRALVLNGNSRRVRTTITVGIDEHLPTPKETSNGRRETWRDSQCRVSNSDGLSRNAPRTHISQEPRSPLNPSSSVRQ